MCRDKVVFGFVGRPAAEPIPKMYTAGFSVQTAQRLATITTYAYGDSTNWVSQYTLAYDSTGGTLYNHSLLQSVTRAGQNVDPLPAITLTTAGTIDTFAPQTVPAKLYSLRYMNWVGDFNGDGKADLLGWVVDATGYQFRVYLTNSAGDSFESGQIWSCCRTYSSGPWFWLGDYNGDGRTDVFSVAGGQKHLCLTNTTATGFTDLTVTATVVSGDGLTPWVWVGDYNGDGESRGVSP